jgi:WD40 repeat protein
LWDLKFNGASVRLPGSLTNYASGVAFSPASDLLAVGFANTRLIRLYNLNTGSIVRDLDAREFSITKMGFSADGLQLITAGTSRIISIWDLSKFEETAVLSGSREGITALELSPDGRTIVSAAEDRFVRFWNVATGRETARIRIEQPAQYLAFTRDATGLLLTFGHGHKSETVTRYIDLPSVEETDRAP